MDGGNCDLWLSGGGDVGCGGRESSSRRWGQWSHLLGEEWSSSLQVRTAHTATLLLGRAQGRQTTSSSAQNGPQVCGLGTWVAHRSRRELMMLATYLRCALSHDAVFLLTTNSASRAVASQLRQTLDRHNGPYRLVQVGRQQSCGAIFPAHPSLEPPSRVLLSIIHLHHQFFQDA